MNKWFSLWLVACLPAALLMHDNGQAQVRPTGQLTVQNQVDEVDEKGNKKLFFTLVTLYKDGQAVRSTELPNDGDLIWMVNWKELTLGPYEVHFEARGRGKVVKRITISPDARTTVVLRAMDRNDELWGAGPTLKQLEKRIADLEAKVANR